MDKNIKIFFDLNSIYNKSNKTYREDYMNLCFEFADIADLTIVFSEVFEINKLKKQLNLQCKNVTFITCESIENINFDIPEAKAIFVISDMYKTVEIERKIIKFSLDFDSIENRYSNASLVSLVKEKLIYNLFSSDFSFLINKDTKNECNFLQYVFQKNNISSGKILDCCCGVGRHDALLSNCGYEILGIDISEKQIETANKTNKNNLINYMVGDIRNYKLPYKQFNGAFCMWTSFNYFNKEEMHSFINNVYEGLKDGAIFILDTKNFTSPTQYKTYIKTLENETKKVFILVIKRVKNKMQTSKYIYFIYDKSAQKADCFVDNELINIYTKTNILNIVKDKFLIIDAFGGYDASPFNKDKSDRMILVLKKV